MTFFKKTVYCVVLLMVAGLTIPACVNKKIRFEKIPVQCPDYWPTRGWRKTSPEKQGMRSDLLVKMFEKIQKENYAIDSISIIRNGYLVTDAYFYPFKKKKRHLIYSCTKSITSAIVGIAIDKGYIKSVKQPVVKFFPGRKIANMDARKKSMTLEHLLTMTSGLGVTDSYRFNDQGIFEMVMSNDWAQYVLDRPMIKDPGTEYEYSNGVSYLLSAIVQETTGMTTLTFAKKHLFKPLGITDIEWTASPQGINIGGSDIWMRPHDMAKIGLLYLNKGQWNGKQIVPKAWVEASTRPHIKERLYDYYGYQWRIDNEGYYLAVGRFGQNIFVIPDKNMVVVFTSDMHPGNYYVTSELVNDYIIPAVASPIPLPENNRSASRLNNMIKHYAAKPARGDIWISEAQGVAKNGIFIRRKLPVFKFKFPESSKKMPLEAPGQVMCIRTPARVNIQASVIDIPEYTSLSDLGPRFYAKVLKHAGFDIQVKSNQEIVLGDRTRAYKTHIVWKYRDGTPLVTWIVSAYKEGKCIILAAHHKWYTYRAVPILESLMLKL